MGVKRKGGHGGGGGGGGGHDGGGGLRWLLTYADMITLLLALFIYLYSVSSVNETALAEFTSSFASMFGIGSLPVPENTPGGGSGMAPVSGGQAGKGPNDKESHSRRRIRRINQPLDHEQLHQLRQELEQKLPTLVDDEKLSFAETREGLTLRFKSSALFPLGSSQVASDALPILAEIASQLRDLANDIRVEGHTDDLPVSGQTFGSNWELSSARAAAVLNYFINAGNMSPARLSLAGYGEYRPIAPNFPGQGNPQNRRVEILVLAPSEDELEAMPALPGTPEP